MNWLRLLFRSSREACDSRADDRAADQVTMRKSIVGMLTIACDVWGGTGTRKETRNDEWTGMRSLTVRVKCRACFGTGRKIAPRKGTA